MEVGANQVGGLVSLLLLGLLGLLGLGLLHLGKDVELLGHGLQFFVHLLLGVGGDVVVLQAGLLLVLLLPPTLEPVSSCQENIESVEYYCKTENAFFTFRFLEFVWERRSRTQKQKFCFFYK